MSLLEAIRKTRRPDQKRSKTEIVKRNLRRVNVNNIRKVFKVGKGIKVINKNKSTVKASGVLSGGFLRNEIINKRRIDTEPRNVNIKIIKGFLGSRVEDNKLAVTYVDKNNNLKTAYANKKVRDFYKSKLSKRYDIKFKKIKSNRMVLENFSTPTTKFRKEFINKLLKLKRARSDRLYVEFPTGERYMVNDNNIELLKRKFIDGEKITVGIKKEFNDSDIEVTDLFGKVSNVKVGRFLKSKKKRNKSRESNFFPYRVKSNIYNSKFSKYGLYQNINEDNENCVVRVLKLSGIYTKQQIDLLKRNVKDRYVSFSYLDKFGKQTKTKISIRYYDDKKKNKSTRLFGDLKSNKIVKAGSICKHLFIMNNDTGVTSFYLKNFEDLNKVEKIKHEQCKKNNNKRTFRAWQYFRNHKHRIVKRRKDKKGNYKYEYTKDKFATSSFLFKFLIENKNKFLEELSLSDVDVLKSYYTDKVNDIKDLEYDEETCVADIKSRNLTKCKNKKCRYCKEKFNSCKMHRNRTKVGFDFESSTYNHPTNKNKKRGKKHKDYLGRAIICKRTYKKPRKIRFNCAYDFLDQVETQSLLIAHNLSYDFQFLLPHLHNLSIIKKGNSIMSASGKFTDEHGNVKVLYFKDSLRVIPTKLGNFGKWFGLKQNKEVMPYKVYNDGDLDKEIRLLHCLKYFSNSSDKLQFLKNCREWGCIYVKNGKLYFNKKRYSGRYCLIDCEVLMKGYETFNNWVKNLCKLAYKNRDAKYPKLLNELVKEKRMTEEEANEIISNFRYDPIDISDFISIPSIVNELLIRCGCYDGVKKLAGVPRMFIQKSVVGGRTMTRANKKWHVMRNLQDFDAVSCYSSACVELIGLLRGSPKVLKKFKYNDIKNYSGYFVEIEVLNIPKKYNFPLLSYKNDKGIRTFTNDASKIGRIVVDNISLEDCIKFHEMKPDVDFKIIKGYYFDEGYNKMLKPTVQCLFNERLKLKQKKNNAQLAYKLMLNSLKLLREIGEYIIKCIMSSSQVRK
jgi:hypothetical protein